LFGPLADEESPLVKHYNDDYYTDVTFKLFSKSKYFASHIKLGKKDKSVEFVDTRFMTVQNAMRMLSYMTAPIEWKNFELNAASIRPNNQFGRP